MKSFPKTKMNVSLPIALSRKPGSGKLQDTYHVIPGPRALRQGLKTVIPQLNEKDGVLAVTKVLLRNVVLPPTCFRMRKARLCAEPNENPIQELGRRKQVAVQLLTKAHLGESSVGIL
jgi:hypothetical protein